ncbi:MAG: pirin family protein [Bacteroidetes bacterium]|nr:pirin family protein [Bacteroidota bacterium]
MSKIDFIIPERKADIGNFAVGRLLPFREKRLVGPFIYMDHMGPALLSPGENLDVGPHPHIGLSTLTYLLEGTIMHRDSLGTEIEIKPGEVNWMTAGEGIVHSERTPEYLRGGEKSLHGLQIWIALPKELESTTPDFFHAGKEEIPVWEEGDIEFTLIAGEGSGRKSTVPVYSKLFLIQVKNKEKALLKLKDKLFGEVGLYILDGGITYDGVRYDPRQMLVFEKNDIDEMELLPDSTIFILGGEPFPEGRKIYWNFVATEEKLIEEAAERWRNMKFPPVPNDDGYIPLPDAKFRIRK